MRLAVAWVLLAPRNILVATLKVYRAVISPLYGDVCRYYPSCSHYAMQAIQHHGVVRGVWLGSRRLTRCHPWAEGGVDDIPSPLHGRVAINRFGFAVPNSCAVSATSFASSDGKV
ncbi:membrane protein insertion efficiency factor YidD [Salinibacterium xinjiangense]|uniref:membrane protein insertion efficiency factor YidD n=1 Tax=Salinibacterium xinjiangense TaxID=386302 RepID=UPI000BE2B56B|nr:membrane protein insertion efficiency factor YidD [Salinibacterium xinjiangense]